MSQKQTNHKSVYCSQDLLMKALEDSGLISQPISFRFSMPNSKTRQSLPNKKEPIVSRKRDHKTEWRIELVMDITGCMRDDAVAALERVGNAFDACTLIKNA